MGVVYWGFDRRPSGTARAKGLTLQASLSLNPDKSKETGPAGPWKYLALNSGWDA